jgi:hypothetical protein
VRLRSLETAPRGVERSLQPVSAAVLRWGIMNRLRARGSIAGKGKRSFSKTSGPAVRPSQCPGGSSG